MPSVRPRRVVGEAEIVEHGRQEHQLAIDLRAVLLRKKLAEPVAAHDVVEEHVAGHQARELSGLAGNAAIGNFDIGDHAELLTIRVVFYRIFAIAIVMAAASSLGASKGDK